MAERIVSVKVNIQTMLEQASMNAAIKQLGEVRQAFAKPLVLSSNFADVEKLTKVLERQSNALIEIETIERRIAEFRASEDATKGAQAHLQTLREQATVLKDIARLQGKNYGVPMTPPSEPAEKLGPYATTEDKRKWRRLHAAKNVSEEAKVENEFQKQELLRRSYGARTIAREVAQLGGIKPESLKDFGGTEGIPKSVLSESGRGIDDIVHELQGRLTESSNVENEDDLIAKILSHHLINKGHFEEHQFRREERQVYEREAGVEDDEPPFGFDVPDEGDPARFTHQEVRPEPARFPSTEIIQPEKVSPEVEIRKVQSSPKIEPPVKVPEVKPAPKIEPQTEEEIRAEIKSLSEQINQAEKNNDKGLHYVKMIHARDRLYNELHSRGLPMGIGPMPELPPVERPPEERVKSSSKVPYASFEIPPESHEEFRELSKKIGVEKALEHFLGNQPGNLMGNPFQYRDLPVGPHLPVPTGPPGGGEYRPPIELFERERRAGRLPSRILEKPEEIDLQANKVYSERKYFETDTGKADLAERVRLTRELVTEEQRLQVTRLDLLRMSFRDPEYNDMLRGRLALRQAEARTLRAGVLVDRKEIGSTQHISVLRDEMNLRKELARNERMERRVGLGVEYGPIGGKLVELSDKFETFGKRSTMAFVAANAAILGMVRAASPDAFNTLSGSIALLAGEIGISFIPQIVRASGLLQRAKYIVQGMDDGTKDSIVKWTMYGVTLAGVGVVAGRLAPIFRLTAAAMSSPWGLAIGGAIALAHATGLLKYSMDNLGPAALATGGYFASLSQTQWQLASGIGATTLVGLGAVNMFMRFRGASTAATAATSATGQVLVGLGVNAATATVASRGLLASLGGIALAHPVITALVAIGAAATVMALAFRNGEESIESMASSARRFQGVARTLQHQAPSQLTTQQLTEAGLTGQQIEGLQRNPTGEAFQNRVQAIIGDAQARLRFERREQAKITLIQSILERSDITHQGPLGTNFVQGERIRTFATDRANEFRRRYERMLIEQGMAPQSAAVTARVEAERQRNRGTFGNTNVSAFNPTATVPALPREEIVRILEGLRRNPSQAAATLQAGQALLRLGHFPVEAGTTFRDLFTKLSINLQPKQMGVEALHDYIQQESIKGPLEQERFEQQMRALRALIDAVTNSGGNIVQALGRPVPANLEGAGP
ncbi:MAG: hypothetical protein KGJ09_09260 [Candidatus Omnitrophica bacterium]|nr:hypothetical protein [Candidatus Omnitrophota bacterium]